jgi:hypothetical protein
MEKTFRTPELLEAILLQLPMRSLLHAQRVSHEWKSAITTSPLLQQALFLSAKRPRVGSSRAKTQVNTLLQAVFPPFFLFETHEGDPESGKGSTRQWNEYIKMNDALLRKDASWRIMFPTQPPPSVKIVERASQWSCSERRGTLFGHEHESPLVRMGAIYDYVERAMGDQDTMYFHLDWHALRTSRNQSKHEEKTPGLEVPTCEDGDKETEDGVTIYTRAYLSCLRGLGHNPPRYQSIGFENPKLELGEWGKLS